jgi:hypothetical protein
MVLTPEFPSLADAYCLIEVRSSDPGQKHFQVLANLVADEDQARQLFDALSKAAVRFLNVLPSHVALGCARSGASGRSFAPTSRC